MNITSTLAQYAALQSQNGSYTKAQNSSAEAPTSAATPQAKTVNLRDVSINEINALIKSGKTALLDAVPYIPLSLSGSLDKNAHAIGEYRVDLLGQIEGSIAFNKSLGKPADNLQRILSDLKAIDGTELPSNTATNARSNNQNNDRVSISREGLAAAIVDKYDFYNITPKHISAMSSELYEADIISFNEHVLLSFQMEQNPSYENLLGEGLGKGQDALHQPKNLFNFWQSQVELQRKSGAPESFVQQSQHILNLVHQLHALKPGQA